MLSRPLLVAAVAAGLLVVSVGADLAFTSHVEVHAGRAGDELVLVGQGQLDGRPSYSYARPTTTGEPFRANASDSITLEVTLHNAYPWPTSRTFALTRDGCYEGASTLATLRVSASGSGEGKARSSIPVQTLLREYGTLYPKPVDGPEADVQQVYLQVCRGMRDVATASFSVQEVSA